MSRRFDDILMAIAAIAMITMAIYFSFPSEGKHVEEAQVYDYGCDEVMIALAVGVVYPPEGAPVVDFCRKIKTQKRSSQF